MLSRDVTEEQSRDYERTNISSKELENDYFSMGSAHFYA